MSIIIYRLLFVCFVGHACAEYVSSDQWATHKDGEYTVRNDVWGSGHGTSTLHIASHNNWFVHADHPNTGGIKAYTHVAKAANKKISALGTCTSSFQVSVPNGGAYETAYDIWLDNNKYEIMLWMNQHGAVGPIGASAATATVGGHSWNVHKGSNGANEVFSFVRTTGNTNSGTVDVKAILQWIEKEGWFKDEELGEIQFGFEITSSAGGMDFKVNSFDVKC